MRIAITSWNNRIAPVFDVSRQIILVETQGKTIKQKGEMTFAAGSALEKISFLKANEVDVVICGAISRPTYLSAEAQGLKVRAFLSGEVFEVLQAFLEDRLDEVDFTMPGCGRQGGGCGGRMRRGRAGGRGFRKFDGRNF